ncbi:endonuclease domain-containing protein [Nocardioides sp. NPDC051685]|uniref:endonuclease domain-containing protein n=1 Tax=Nocardioides sp. NPDC051685 TaxID=3364334 RepID=UPI0037B522F1
METVRHAFTDRPVEEQLAVLRELLIPDRSGHCRPYVITPDSAIHVRSDTRWEGRYWARLENRDWGSGWGGGWVVAATSLTPWKQASRMVPVHHRIAPAEHEARRRARQRRGQEARLRRRQSDIDNAVSQGPHAWTTPEFRDWLRTLEVITARQIMLRILSDLQRGQCAICDRPRRLVLDHDHVTGLVRGALCSACNAAEGGGGLGPPPPATLIERYRTDPPAQGLRWIYPTSDRSSLPWTFR